MRQSIRDLLTDAALDYVGHFMEPKPIQAGFFFGTTATRHLRSERAACRDAI